jgi:N-acetylglutamate synthase-like GNAT family acetyltransferase
MNAEIIFVDTLDGISDTQLDGFCVDWPRGLSGTSLERVLRGSAKFWLAIDRGNVVGFVNAIADGCFMACIPLLEVRPEWKGRGIGTELVRRMAASLSEYYALDLLCDEELVPFYEKLGFFRVAGMVRRNPKCTLFDL